MTRDEVIEGLEAMVHVAWLSKITEQEQTILRGSLALLRVPDSMEVEAARKWLNLDRTGDACCNKDRDVPGYDNSGCEYLACTGCPPRVACLLALDALARSRVLSQCADIVRANLDCPVLP